MIGSFKSTSKLGDVGPIKPFHLPRYESQDSFIDQTESYNQHSPNPKNLAVQPELK